MAYAQQQQQQAVDPWSEAIKAAQSKVEAATSPGAFGHGVPGLHNITAQEVLTAFGVTALDALLVYGIIRLAANSREKTKRDQLITAASAHKSIWYPQNKRLGHFLFLPFFKRLLFYS